MTTPRVLEPKVSVVSVVEVVETPRRRRTTALLVAAIALLAAIAILEALYLTGGGPAPSADRPVVTSDLSRRSAVDAAASSTEQILSTSYRNYDKQVGQATSLMTGPFAAQYRRTAEGVEGRFVAARTELQVKVVAQGVVRASSDEVQALLFMNQYVQKLGEGAHPGTSFAQYRALVTVVHTDKGWLVSDIKTR